jgi:release factor glutamine methyltransferase
MNRIDIRLLLTDAERALAVGPHPDRARQDAEFLLRFALRCDKAWLLTRLRNTVSDEVQDYFNAMVRRRIAGEPIQYVTGEATFFNMQFRVTPDVLIPRPETELLVERVTQLIPVFLPQSDRFFEFRKVTPHTWRDAATAIDAKDTASERNTPHHTPRILDVGTGSGCIAICITHDWDEAEITAIDLSPSALEVARFNAESLGIADQIRFLQGDLLTPVAGEQFEIIVSNPPYVAESDRDQLSVEVRDHEPALALFAGEDGLDVYRRLIPAAFDALVPGGFLLLEIGYGQSPAIAELLTCSGFEQIEFTPDLQGIPRVACARRP